MTGEWQKNSQKSVTKSWSSRLISTLFHFFAILRDTLSALDIGQKVAKITQREQDKQTTRHRTNFLSDNCQRVGFRNADSHSGRKFRSPLKYLCTAWEDQLIRRDDQGSQIFSDDVLLHGLLAHQALALGITRGPQDRAVLPKRPTRRREAAEFERTLMLA